MRMEEILRTNDPVTLSFAEALLRGEEIDSFVMDVHMSVLEGSIGVLPRRMLVARANAFRARAILSDNDIEVSRPR
ncbi:Putative signal transducing protein [Monaibacterium marinum]|uniref:Signal transducing protein n=2 Tax=Pontivivens marinum TaxID=1690039 RepID=A0A2C9CS37_9RHOB|nr:Putative signal transducing protein [Monaibacterium marinum]